MTELSGRQKQTLNQALIKAFPVYDTLAMMVNFGLNESLAAIAGDGPLEYVAFKLIIWAEARGRLEVLLRAARNANPTNPQLLQFLEELQLASPLPPAGELERILRSAAGFQNPTQWRERMAACELAVCRVEFQLSYENAGIGTGFLVRPDRVMTNYHVMEDVIEGRVPAGKVVLRFDYKTELDGVTVKAGQEHRLAANWDLCHSPVRELDYTLLQVEGTPGSDPVGGQMGAPSRGWLTPVDHTFERTEPLLILQHPEAKPLKLAFGSVRDVDAPAKRIVHDVSTEPGSSGSPCFDSDWDLVALHHRGKDTGNRAVHFGAILEDLQQRGKRGLLGGGDLAAGPRSAAERAESAVGESSVAAVSGGADRDTPSIQPPAGSPRQGRNRPPSAPD
jgi:V8-like Glu-specific endopeptidase